MEKKSYLLPIPLVYIFIFLTQARKLNNPANSQYNKVRLISQRNDIYSKHTIKGLY